jgi:hypothetical protein
VKTKGENKMNKLLIMTTAVVVGTVDRGQEFGQGESLPAEVSPATVEAVKELPPPVGEGSGVEQVQQVMNEEVAPAQTAIDAIEEAVASASCLQRE